MKKKMESCDFNISEDARKKLKYTLWFFVSIVAVSCLAFMVFLSGYYKSFFAIHLWPILIFGFLSLLLSVYYYQNLVRLIKLAVSLDEDGIWFTYLGKTEGLVKWSMVRNLKRTFFLKELVLIDENNQTLINIDNRLEDIGELKSIIAYCLKNLTPRSVPLLVRRKKSERLEDVFMYTFFLGLCVFTFNKNEYFGFSFFFLILIFILHSTIKNQIQKVKITSEQLVIYYIFHRKSFRKESIEAFGFFDSVENGQHQASVWLQVCSDEYLQIIEGMNIHPIELYRVLFDAFPKAR